MLWDRNLWLLEWLYVQETSNNFQQATEDIFNKIPLYGTNQLYEVLNTLQVKDLYKARILKFTFECLKSAPLSMFQDYFNNSITEAFEI